MWTGQLEIEVAGRKDQLYCKVCLAEDTTNITSSLEIFPKSISKVGKFWSDFKILQTWTEQWKVSNNFISESLSLDATSSSISSTGDITDQENNLMKIIENLNLNILRLKPSLILLWYECWLIYLIWALPSWWPVSKVVSSQSLLSTIYSFILVGESRNLFLKQFSFILMINSGPHSTAFLVCRGGRNGTFPPSNRETRWSSFFLAGLAGPVL